MAQVKRMCITFNIVCISLTWGHRTIVEVDIEAIISRGEDRMQQVMSKYEGLNLEDLCNFKSNSSVQQWEGEDFRTGVRGVFS